ncbi:hypothetical protein ES705_20722 [subsurface metagenome]
MKIKGSDDTLDPCPSKRILRKIGYITDQKTYNPYYKTRMHVMAVKY